MRKWLRGHPFLTLGLGTLLLFFLAETLRELGGVEANQRLAVPLRVLIIPMYLVWLVFTMLNVAIAGPAGLGGALGVLFHGIQLVTGLAPYVGADLLLRRWRNAQSRRHVAA